MNKLILLILALAPIMKLNWIITAVIGILLILNTYKFIGSSNKDYFRWKSLKIYYIFILVIIFILFTQMIITGFSEGINKEMSRMIFYLVLVLDRTLIFKIKELYEITKIVLGINFSVQILQFFYLKKTNDFLFEYYLKKEGNLHTLYLDNSSLANFRSGALYSNPNVLGAFCLIFSVITFEYLLRNKKENYLMTFILFLSIMLTGSRTAFVIFIIIYCYYYYKRLKKIKNIAICFIGSAALIAFFYQKSIRVFTGLIVNDSNNSMGAKITIFKKFIFESSYGIKELIFGISPYKGVQFDAEIAYILMWYGIVGLIVYLYLIFGILNKKNRVFKVFSIVFLLIGLSNSIIFNIVIFPYTIIMMKSLELKKL